MAKRSRLSLAEERLLAQLAAQGKSLDAIANTMKRPPETVRRVAKRLGVSIRLKPKS
jgi:DNA-binding CsgD family transcriptional regulator